MASARLPGNVGVRAGRPRDVAGRVICDDLRSAFTSTFGGEPTHLSRAPGRVNLIGEHIDYNGLPVFPMALHKEVRVALRPRDDGVVVLHNTGGEFLTVEFEITPAIEPYVQGAWGNYVKAPANELAHRFAIRRGFDGIVSSNLPVASGLSSSSALVMAVGLALARINEVATDVGRLAPLMAEAERYVGTRGGAMDQAISLGARDRCAARITFDPVRLRHVNVPDDWCFVVADSGERVQKSGSAMAAYNRRREECDEALRVVAGHVATAGVTRKLFTSYPDLVGAVDVKTLIEVAETVLDGNLLRRFRHVVTEANRVDEAVDRMFAADVIEFGALMDRSHASLTTDFHVSSVALDELVAIAREGGAAGARLTGAGFGGSVVALADRWTVGGVIETLIEEYYERREMADGIDDRVFVGVPSRGATYEELEG